MRCERRDITGAVPHRVIRQGKALSRRRLHSAESGSLRTHECKGRIPMKGDSISSGMDTAQVRMSRFLSLILRHKPEVAGLELDESGWCGVEALLEGCASRGY